MKRLNWFLLGITYLSLLVYGLADNARGPIFPDLLREYSLSDRAGSWFFLIASAGSLVNNLLASVWLGRLGAYRALQIYSVLQSVALIGIGIAGGVDLGYAWILASSALFGVATGGLGISQNLLVAEAAPVALRRQALSGLHCMYGVSSLLAPLMVTGWYAMGGEWHRFFAWIAIGSLVVAAFSLRATPELKGAPERALGFESKPAVSAEGDGERKLLRKRTAYLASILSLYVISEVGLSSRLVLFARRDVGLPVEKANLLLSGFFLALFLGRFLFAVVHVPLRNDRLLSLSAALSVVCFSLGLLHHPAWLSLCGLTMSWYYPSAMALISEQMGRDSAFATSWCVTVQSLGLMMMHFLLGELSDSFGLLAALWVGPICLALCVVLLVLKRRSALFPA